MSEINIKTRIIGKSGNLLILSNDWDASLDDPLAEGFIVEVDTGVHLTETYPIDYLFRINEELEWTPMNVFYDKVYPEYNKCNYSRDGLIGLAVGDALGVPVEMIHGTIRFTIGDFTTKEDVDYVVEKLTMIVTRLRELSPVNATKGW